MKKIYTNLFLLLILLAASNSIAGDRTILIERFTSSTCPPCATNNPIMDAFLGAQDPSKVTGISFHMNWPAPGNDPMFLINPTDNTTRRNYYNVNAIPVARFDGSTQVNSPYNQSSLQSLYNSRINVLSPVTVIVRDSTFGDSVMVTAMVYTETLLSNPSAVLQIAVIEKNIQYGSPPGTNGETHFHDVMRMMLPTASGTQLILMPGHVNIVSYKYKKNPVWQPTEIRHIAFVQNSDREIYTASQKTFDFNLFSTNGVKVVNPGSSQFADYSIQVPYTAAGYNSPVTFSAVIEPAVSGVTASFPSGNTLSSFPGAVPFRVNSTASVPSGVYKAIITAANSIGDTHKIVVNYLVGKNWVSVGTNKPNVFISVNNVNFVGRKMYEWDFNTTQTTSVTSPQDFANTRYVFTSWENGDTNLIRTINVNASQSDYTANFKTQFKLNASVSPSGIPVTVNNGGMFHDSAAAVNVSLSATQVNHNGKIYYFNRWVGGGVGSYTGTNAAFTVNLSNSINQIAVFDTVNVSIQQNGTEIPDKFALYQNYPNPFNPVTNIKFDIPRAGLVKLSVYNTLGEETAVLHNGYLGYGRFTAVFDASSLPSGVYFYKITAEGFTDIKRLVVLK